MKLSFVVTLEKPDGVSARELASVIREAVREWGYNSAVMYSGYDAKTDEHYLSPLYAFGKNATVKLMRSQP